MNEEEWEQRRAKSDVCIFLQRIRRGVYPRILNEAVMSKIVEKKAGCR